MRIVPLSDRIVVRRLDPDERSPGGIVLPESARKSSQTGRVLAVGDGRLLGDGSRARPQVGEGDRVLFDRYAGSPVTVNGDDLLILGEGDILVVWQ
jgi:chaperonin GroES